MAEHMEDRKPTHTHFEVGCPVFQKWSKQMATSPQSKWKTEKKEKAPRACGEWTGGEATSSQKNRSLGQEFLGRKGY